MNRRKRREKSAGVGDGADEYLALREQAAMRDAGSVLPRQESKVSLAERAREVPVVLEMLTPEQAWTLVLLAMGWSLQRCAEACGVGEGAIKKRRNRALKKARGLLT